jgi:hypothetical protein
LFVLERDPFLTTTALFEDEPERRIIRSRALMDGFEVTCGFEVDEARRLVTLGWIDRVFIEEPQS